jgi:hypothetical protein
MKPLSKRQQERLDNAIRIGTAIKQFLSTGHLVFNEEGEPVTKVEFESNGVLGLYIESVAYMIGDPDLDNGLELSIADFRNQFAGWRIVHPRHFRSLVIPKKEAPHGS